MSYLTDRQDANPSAPQRWNWFLTTPKASWAANTPNTILSPSKGRLAATASLRSSLNGSRCRRKDITDLFLGTGLGSRSYAIIEQGTISRMVEAKPDELRVHIEEAAGISKYKERRSETETRMKNTRENLERLDDLREEVDKQLKHLQKQAEKAEKYTELKKQERQFKLELLAMRWNTYHQAAKQLETKLQDVATEHNRLFVKLRDIDSAIEAKRAEHKTQQQQLNTAQGDYYTVVAEVGISRASDQTSCRKP